MEKQLIPKLRFPEFKENWVELKYKDLYTFKVTNSFSRDNLNYEKGNVKNIHYGDIHTKFNSHFDINNENVPFINNEINISKIPDDCYLQEGDLVVADASEDYGDIGKMIEIINLNNEKVLAGLHTFLARKNSDKIVNGFSSFLMKSWKVRYQIMRIAQGTKVLSLSNKRLSEIELQIPQPEEQQKITSFLTSVDKRIVLLSQQKEKLELYKKGIMQQLFSQEIRFKEDNGNDFPDWEEFSIKSISTKIWIGLVTTMTKYYTSKGVRLIRNSNIRDNKIVDDKPIFLEKNFADSFTDRKLQKGDVITVHTGDVGTSAVIDDVYDGCHGFATLNTRVNNKVLNTYLSFYLNSYNYKKWALRYSTGDGRNNFNLNDFIKSKIPIPNISEQQKIATFLTAIDVQIEQVGKRIETTTSFKKGLLQQMFV